MIRSFTLIALSSFFFLVSAELCGSKIIEIGDSMHKIRSRCGEPTSTAVIGEIKGRDASAEMKLYITEWAYDEPMKTQILVFHGSSLVSVREEKK